MDSAIPFFLITGFLGSGKTTLLKNFISSYASNKRLLVIQNEFGDVSIDAVALPKTPQKFYTLEINKGSVFCVCLLQEFRTSLKKAIAELEPEAVILEATGLADPIAIAQIMESEDLKALVFLKYVWCVVDAANFLKMETVNTQVAHQVRIADGLVVNKIDLADERQLDEVLKRLKTLNPFAEMFKTSYARMDVEFVSDRMEESVAIRRKVEHSSLPSGNRPKVSTLTLRFTDLIEREKIENFCREYANICYRIKGYANLAEGGTLAVQCVGGICEFKPVPEYKGPAALIFLGHNFDAGALKNIFAKKCLKVARSAAKKLKPD
jgi:G3E family GTPase